MALVYLVFFSYLPGKPERTPMFEAISVWQGEIPKNRTQAIEPELVVFDPHHHLWDPFTQPKGWPVHPWVLKLLGYLKPAVLMKLGGFQPSGS